MDLRPETVGALVEEGMDGVGSLSVLMRASRSRELARVDIVCKGVTIMQR